MFIFTPTLNWISIAWIKNLDANNKRHPYFAGSRFSSLITSIRSVWKKLKEIWSPCLLLSVTQHHCKTEKTMGLIASAWFYQDVTVRQLVASVSWKCDHLLVECGLLIIWPDFVWLVSHHRSALLHIVNISCLYITIISITHHRYFQCTWVLNYATII